MPQTHCGSSQTTQPLARTRPKKRISGPSPSKVGVGVRLCVGVAVTGTAFTPRVKLVSEPAMSDSDKLTWLVLGREPGALGRTDTAVLQSAALALFAGEGGGPTDELGRLIPLDTLSVGQRETGSVTETVVSLGRQVSKHWYVGYERSLSATSGTWQLIYRVAQRFTLRAQAGEDNSFDAIYTWRWR